jgi:branched-subunit amino acid ABC-type transport system permease component
MAAVAKPLRFGLLGFISSGSTTMAASSLLALIDDIATLLDDVAAMTKVAARQGAAAADDVAAMTQLAVKKTAGVLVYVLMALILLWKPAGLFKAG